MTQNLFAIRRVADGWLFAGFQYEGAGRMNAGWTNPKGGFARPLVMTEVDVGDALADLAKLPNPIPVVRVRVTFEEV